MSIDPIFPKYPKSSGMAGINRFEKFSRDELRILTGVLRLFDPFLGIEDPNYTKDFKEYIAREKESAAKLLGEMWAAFIDKEQKAKTTNSAYPCPECHNPSVFCGCSSSCNHGSGPHPLRYCNHCEKSF